MRLKNEIFAHVLDWLVQKEMVVDQKDLAIKTGISQNTVSRIMTGKVEPSDDTLRKLNATFGNIFNMEYLRGRDPFNMLIEDVIESHQEKATEENPQKQQDFSAMLEEITAFAKQTISTLEKQVADKDEEMKRLRHELSEKDSTIRMQQSILRTLQEQVECYQRTQAIISDPTKYPFPVGSAEPGNETDRVNI